MSLAIALQAKKARARRATEFTGGYPRCRDSARFTFPGAQYGGSVSEGEDGQGLKWYVAQGDKAAWDYFIAEKPAA
ncbi:hypothetical protein ABOC32_16865 [Pseudomonas sp. WOUb67]|uniref:hypothetical protein n=1 Tax=Pseudomonas sp. WOUb67 TaxID=3161136 RepID=UPI003CE7E531